MALSEFDLIQQFFSSATLRREDVTQGIGDDCALLTPPPGVEIAVTTDTLVEGVHFSPGCDPEALGHKALAVNLSDLAAMGAEPAWFFLALTLPKSSEAWLRGFTRGMADLAHHHQITLAGGDTTRGACAITITAIGFVTPDHRLLRSEAGVGDKIYLSNVIGDAALALHFIKQNRAQAPEITPLLARLHRPTPRVELGRAISTIASAAIDISDGLVQDLEHLCTQSGVGADIELNAIPLSSAVSTYLKQSKNWEPIICGGDDYELCFTVPPDRVGALESLQETQSCRLTPIGEVVTQKGVRCVQADGSLLVLESKGYEHFSDRP